jgi:hypothetical protein
MAGIMNDLSDMKTLDEPSSIYKLSALARGSGFERALRHAAF